MGHDSRRVISLNVTAHSTAAWSIQQLRETIPSDHTYRFIIHDHDAIFSAELDASLARLGLKVIRSETSDQCLPAVVSRQDATLSA
jgi:putative transposase